MEKVICFDIGGTNVKYGILDKNGSILEKSLFKTNTKNGQEILDNMSKIIEEYKDSDVVGISISSPGFINKTLGEITSGTIIEGFIGLNIKKYFEDKFNLKVAVENDANCAVIAEHTMGNGVGYENVVCLTIGTGIGGGIIINNKIYNGSSFMAGEFGFMFINGIDHEVLENHLFSNYASTRALIENTSMYLGKDIDGVSIFERAKNGDHVCEKTISDFYDNLAIGIYNIFYILNPDKILIGGAISKQEDIIDEIKIRLEKFTPSFSNNINDYVILDRCKFLNDAGLIGSLCNFISTYN